MLRLLILAALTTLLSVSTPGRASANNEAAHEIHPYAPLKRPRLPIVGRDSLGFILKGPYPAHGVLLAQGNFLGPVAGWTIIDFDVGTMQVLQTATQTLPDGKREGVITSHRVAVLPPQELNDIIDGANRIWNPAPTPEPVPSMVTDVTCDLVLFDGSDIVHDSGPVCHSAQLVERIEAISRETR